MKKLSLRFKFLVITIIVAGLFVGLSLYQSIFFHKETVMNQASEFANRLLDNTYSAMRFPMSIGDEKTVEEQLKGIKEHMSGVHVYITDFTKSIIYASEERQINDKIGEYIPEGRVMDALGQSIVTGNAPDQSFLVSDSGEPFLINIKPILNESSCFHCHGSAKKILGAMVVKQSVKKVLTAIAETRNKLIIEFAIALFGLVALINLLFSRFISKRIQELRDITDKVTAGDITVRSTDDYEDSIGKLARNFNTMVTSIKDRIEFANSLKLGIIDPFIMVDPNMKITFINKNAAKMAGLSPDEAIGKPCNEVINSSACETNCPIKKAFETGELTDAKKMSITDKNGNLFHTMCISSTLKDSSGKVLGAFEIIRDITAEVEAEKNLQHAYEREGKAKQDLEKKVQDLSEMLEKVAQGDFTIRGNVSGTDDAMDNLTRRINDTLDAIVHLITQVKIHIIPVIRGIMQIAQGNQSLSQRTQQQASAMEEISATLEKLVKTIGENLENTRQADSLSKEAVTVALEGVNQVEKTAHAMIDMTNANQKVVEMMELINEITFQTNLLSINAAVEAARAGEQGRGFGVVANEIRDLAKRSGAAAKNIQALVREIMDKVTKSGQWVDELRMCFTKIEGMSKQVSDALGEVSQGNEESFMGIEQINQGTQDLSDVNEKNAYFVDEIFQETQKLTEKAQQLHNIAGVFILGDKEVMQKDAFQAESADTFWMDNRKGKTASTPLHSDILNKPTPEEVDDDLLEKEFDKGFEEF